VLRLAALYTAAMSNGVLVLTRGRETLWFNNAAERLLKLRMPQDLGQRIGCSSSRQSKFVPDKFVCPWPPIQSLIYLT
jgi:nitrogen fixation/metabolism regulation signal transduction histidine kinase